MLSQTAGSAAGWENRFSCARGTAVPNPYEKIRNDIEAQKMATVRHSRVVPDAGQLPPLGHGRTLPDRGGGVRIPAYLPQNIADPARHEADSLYRHQRTGIPLPRNGDTRNPLQELPACRKPVLIPHEPDSIEPGRKWYSASCVPVLHTVLSVV